MVVRPQRRLISPGRTSRSSGAVTMVESSRKHGEFDGLYPILPKLAAQTWTPARDDNDVDQLERSAFRTRFFPNRRRHDLAALAAYEAYRHSLAEGSANSIGPKVAVAGSGHQDAGGKAVHVAPNTCRSSTRSR
jgi:hypothetical protein